MTQSDQPTTSRANTVHDRRQVDEAAVVWQVSKVRYPDVAGIQRRHFPQQVGILNSDFLGLLAPLPTPLPVGFDAKLLHHSLDGLLVHTKRLGNPAVAVIPMLIQYGFNLLFEPPIAVGHERLVIQR